MTGHCTAGLQDNNSEKDHLELFWGWLIDDQVNERKRKEKKEESKRKLLALVLERDYYLLVRECMSYFIMQLDACDDTSTAMSVSRRLTQ